MKNQLLTKESIKKYETVSETVAGKETEYSLYEIELSSGAKFFAVGIESEDGSAFAVVGGEEERSRALFRTISSNLVTSCTFYDIVRDNLVAEGDNLYFTN